MSVSPEDVLTTKCATTSLDRTNASRSTVKRDLKNIPSKHSRCESPIVIDLFSRGCMSANSTVFQRFTQISLTRNDLQQWRPLIRVHLPNKFGKFEHDHAVIPTTEPAGHEGIFKADAIQTDADSNLQSIVISSTGTATDTFPEQVKAKFSLRTDKSFTYQVVLDIYVTKYPKTVEMIGNI